MHRHAIQTSDEAVPLIDEAVWSELSDLMGDGLQALVEKFIMLSNDYITNIFAAIDTADPAKVRDNAHPLKSSSQQLSAVQLSVLARVIEQEAAQHQAITPAMREASSQLQEIFRQSTAALRARVS